MRGACWYIIAPGVSQITAQKHDLGSFFIFSSFESTMYGQTDNISFVYLIDMYGRLVPYNFLGLGVTHAA